MGFFYLKGSRLQPVFHRSVSHVIFKIVIQDFAGFRDCCSLGCNSTIMICYLGIVTEFGPILLALEACGGCL
jgi:hypothetical protein